MPMDTLCGMAVPVPLPFASLLLCFAVPPKTALSLFFWDKAEIINFVRAPPKTKSQKNLYFVKSQSDSPLLHRTSSLGNHA